MNAEDDLDESFLAELQARISVWKLDCVENDARPQPDIPRHHITPWEFAYSRHRWSCKEDRRSSDELDHLGECERCCRCDHWPLTEDDLRRLRARHRQVEDMDTDADYYESRLGNEWCEQKYLSERVTSSGEDATANTVPPPPPPAATEPVVALIVHKSTRYVVTNNVSQRGHIVGYTFEYASGVTRSWSHPSATPLGHNHEEVEVRLDLREDEHILRIYLGFGIERGSDWKEVVFETSAARVVKFGTGGWASNMKEVVFETREQWARAVAVWENDGSTVMSGDDGTAIWALTSPPTDPSSRSAAWLHTIGPAIVSVPIASLAPRSEFQVAPPFGFRRGEGGAAGTTTAVASLASIAQAAVCAEWSAAARREAARAVQSMDTLIKNTEQVLAHKRDAVLQELYRSEASREVITLRRRLAEAEARLQEQSEAAAVELCEFGNKGEF